MDMAEIKVYNNIWKNLLLVVLCLAFAWGGGMIVMDVNCPLTMKLLGGWLNIIFFGGGGLLIMVSTLYNRARHIPYLIIHEDRLDIYVQLQGAYHTVHYADVDDFRLINGIFLKQVAIDYKKSALRQKVEESSVLKRQLQAFNLNVIGAMESINADNLTMSGKDICDQLNERLHKFGRHIAE